jgi:hypothetical protein
VFQGKSIPKPPWVWLLLVAVLMSIVSNRQPVPCGPGPHPLSHLQLQILSFQIMSYPPP